jgi:hypothetical protein
MGPPRLRGVVEMKLDKKQTPQLVVLGLLVLLCIGYVSFTFVKPPATEPAPLVIKSAKADAHGKVAVEVQAQPVAGSTTFPDLSAPIARRDPFTVQTLGGDEAAKPSKPAVLKPKALPAPPRLASGKVPPLIPFGSFSPGSTPALSVVRSAENQEPGFVLTGVICGLENVAIIRVNSERHVVKQGQFIGGRYRVLSVSQDGVVLACKDRRIHLKLGGVRNAS